MEVENLRQFRELQKMQFYDKQRHWDKMNRRDCMMRASNNKYT